MANKRMKILVVDDDATIREVLRIRLESWGYRVKQAKDAGQARDLVRSYNPKLVISDVVMPNMDGPAMVARARVSHPHLPVLFMSGYAEEQLRKSIDIANVAFLPKPFSVNQLAQAARDTMAMQPAAE